MSPPSPSQLCAGAQTLQLGAPFAGDLYYWWGDDEPLLPEYDLLTVDSGVPVSGEGSGVIFRGSPVQSCMAVSDGPLPVLLSEAQAAAAAGKWSPATGEVVGEDKELLEQAEAVRRKYEKTRLRGGVRRVDAGTMRGKPAIVHVTLASAADEEATFPAFSQEMLGDVVARGVRRVAGSGALKLLLDDGRAVGVPESLGGVPLDRTLAELGLTDGSDLRLTGVSPFESSWPQYEAIGAPLESFLSEEMWPPCENLGRQDPLNNLVVGSSIKVGVGPQEDNDPSHMAVLVTRDRRVCVNKYALEVHLQVHGTVPITGQAADRLLMAQMKAALVSDRPYAPIYLDLDDDPGLDDVTSFNDHNDLDLEDAPSPPLRFESE